MNPYECLYTSQKNLRTTRIPVAVLFFPLFLWKLWSQFTQETKKKKKTHALTQRRTQPCPRVRKSDERDRRQPKRYVTSMCTLFNVVFLFFFLPLSLRFDYLTNVYGTWHFKKGQQKKNRFKRYEDTYICLNETHRGTWKSCVCALVCRAMFVDGCITVQLADLAVLRCNLHIDVNRPSMSNNPPHSSFSISETSIGRYFGRKQCQLTKTRRVKRRSMLT